MHPETVKVEPALREYFLDPKRGRLLIEMTEEGHFLLSEGYGIYRVPADDELFDSRLRWPELPTEPGACLSYLIESTRGRTAVKRVLVSAAKLYGLRDIMQPAESDWLPVDMTPFSHVAENMLMPTRMLLGPAGEIVRIQQRFLDFAGDEIDTLTRVYRKARNWPQITQIARRTWDGAQPVAHFDKPLAAIAPMLEYSNKELTDGLALMLSRLLQAGAALPAEMHAPFDSLVEVSAG